MRIVDFKVNEDDGITLKLKATTKEFKQLKGDISHLCMFSVDSILKPSKVIKTGARHNAARWFLLPICLRARFHGLDYDRLKCSCLDYGDKVFFIFEARRK
ncbi:hypothetical protein JCM12296A_57910 [Desulfosarcina cetonica]